MGRMALTHIVVKVSGDYITHEGDLASCKQYVSNAVSLGFAFSRDFVVLERIPANLKKFR